jgi:LPS-assembly lipoprotein
MTGVMRPRLAALATAAALALGACGFTPLYATPGVTPGLASIEVKVPHGRLAYLIGEQLNDNFARDKDKPPVYRLEVAVTERRYARGLNLDQTAAYYEDHAIVSYKLIEIATGKVVKTSVDPIEVSYAATDQPYAGIAAQEDAQQRAANVAGIRVRTDLSIYFAKLAEK